MGYFLAFIGFISFVVFILLSVVGAVKKNGKAKKRLAYAGASFIVLIIGLTITPSSDTASTDSGSNNKQTEDVALEEEKTEEELEAEKEAAEKAEAEKEAEEEAKKQAEAEQRAKEEAEAKKKAEEEKAQKYAAMASMMVPALHDGLEVQDATYNFITKNYKLFPAFNKEDIEKAKSITDSSISFKHLNKNATPYMDTMTTFAGTVISVEESTEGEDTVSLIHIMDDNYQSYQILMYKTTGDILEDDTVRFWGVPVGPASFENISGGTTNVQFFVGSHIEKQK